LLPFQKSSSSSTPYRDFVANAIKYTHIKYSVTLLYLQQKSNNKAAFLLPKSPELSASFPHNKNASLNDDLSLRKASVIVAIRF